MLLHCGLGCRNEDCWLLIFVIVSWCSSESIRSFCKHVGSGFGSEFWVHESNLETYQLLTLLQLIETVDVDSILGLDDDDKNEGLKLRKDVLRQTVKARFGWLETIHWHALKH